MFFLLIQYLLYRRAYATFNLIILYVAGILDMHNFLHKQGVSSHDDFVSMDAIYRIGMFAGHSACIPYL